MKSKIVIEYVGLKCIRPYPMNPKRHEEKQIQQIANSIARFGFNNPIIIDENSEIIAGHGRYAAAKLLKLEVVPIVKLADLTEAEKRAYRIADNKLTENSQWDVDVLKLEFAAIERLALAFDEELNLDITGFDFKDIDVIMNDSKKDEADEEANHIPYIPANEIVSQPGDIWRLDPHRIICGDSLSEETFIRLFDGAQASMVFTDPPYNVKVADIVGSGKIKHKEFAFASGEMSEIQFIEFLKRALMNMANFSQSGSVHYVCMDWKHIFELLTAGRDVYDKLLNLAVWAKSNGGMGSFYRSQHELVCIFKNGKEPHVNNIELGRHGRYRTNVWNYPGVNSFGEDQDNLKLHPTVKPVELIRDAILDSTRRGDIILDAFLGSGSTLIAAEKTSRACFGIEYEPIYVDTIIRRFQDLTGCKAICETRLETYDTLLKAKLEAGHE